jgi:glutathione peroxidase
MRTAAVLLLGAVVMTANDSMHRFTVKTIDGKEQSLGEYKGKLALVVNVASQCGFTSQYSGLESIFEKYKDRGLVVLGFPSNDFGEQEPGSNEEIKSFCKRNYNVTFPMFSKVPVSGPAKVPLYGYLTQTGGEVGWNFTKFLVGKDGKVITRFKPSTPPESGEVIRAIEAALK